MTLTLSFPNAIFINRLTAPLIGTISFRTNDTYLMLAPSHLTSQIRVLLTAKVLVSIWSSSVISYKK